MSLIDVKKKKENVVQKYICVFPHHSPAPTMICVLWLTSPLSCLPLLDDPRSGSTIEVVEPSRNLNVVGDKAGRL